MENKQIEKGSDTALHIVTTKQDVVVYEKQEIIEKVASLTEALAFWTNMLEEANILGIKTPTEITEEANLKAL